MHLDDIYDFAIIGAGITGSTLALALSKLYNEPSSHPKVLVIERNQAPFSASSDLIKPTRDARALAISLGSLERLKELDIVEAFDSSGELIRGIHVSDQRHWGRVKLTASDFGLSHFGKVVELSKVETIIKRQLSECFNIVTFKWSTIVFGIEASPNGKVITTSTGEKYKAKAVIIAEGGNNQLCRNLGVSYATRDFEKTAIVTTISFSHANSGCAWERFTTTGPLAVLPMSENCFSVVWSLTAADASRLITLSEFDFLQELQKAFGFRAGKIIKLGERQLFPISESIAERQVIEPDIYLFGNTAHSLHPVAGQGFNLTVRDIYFFVFSVAEKIISSYEAFPSHISHLYNEDRVFDVQRTSYYTSMLLSVFLHLNGAVITGRNIGLSLIARHSQLQKKIVSLGANIDPL